MESASGVPPPEPEAHPRHHLEHDVAADVVIVTKPDGSRFSAPLSLVLSLETVVVGALYAPLQDDSGRLALVGAGIHFEQPRLFRLDRPAGHPEGPPIGVQVAPQEQRGRRILLPGAAPLRRMRGD